MLKIQERDNPKHEMWLVKPSVTVGSGAACDFTISSKHIADIHLTLNSKHDKVILTSMSKTRAPLVNDMPVGEYGPLKHGDVIRIGDKVLEIIDPKAFEAERVAKADPLQTVIRPGKSASGDWSMTAVGDWLAGQKFPISDNAVLGREAGSDITIAGTHLSRKHAQFSVTPEGLIVKDLNSSNGTYVNGKRIRQVKLRNGDLLQLDVLKFVINGPADPDDNKTVLRTALPAKARPARPAQQSGNSAGQASTKPQAAAKKWKTKPTSVGNRSAEELSYLNPAQHKDNWLMYSLLILLFASSALLLLTL